MEFIVLIVLLLGIVGLMVYFKRKKVDSENKHRLNDEESVMQQKLLTLEKQYGRRGKVFDKDGFHIWVYDKARILIVYLWSFEKRMVFSFDDIIGCTLTSNTGTSKITVPAHNETTFITKTSKSSMIGRALAGTIIAGPVGAVIGGATAKKNTVGITTTTPERIIQKPTTSFCAVIHVLKDGKEDTIPCYGEGVNDIKSIIDEVILLRDKEKNDRVNY